MIKKLRATERMKQIMGGYYMMGTQAEVKAWVTSGAPVEILYSMDIYPVYPENHGALIGAAKKGEFYSDFAEKNGYSRDLCSYARCDIGCIFAGTSPIGGLPKPTFLFCCNNICNTVVKWYEVLSRMFDVPVFVLDIPFVRKELKDSYIDYVEEQIYEFIEFVEKISGREFSESKLKKTLEMSAEGVSAYKDVLLMGRHKPSQPIPNRYIIPQQADFLVFYCPFTSFYSLLQFCSHFFVKFNRILRTSQAYDWSHIQKRVKTRQWRRFVPPH